MGFITMKKLTLIFIIIGQVIFSTAMARKDHCKKINFPYPGVQAPIELVSLDLEEDTSVFTLETGKSVFQQYLNPCPASVERASDMLNHYLETKDDDIRRNRLYSDLLKVYQKIGKFEFTLIVEGVNEMNKDQAMRLLKKIIYASKDYDDAREDDFFMAMTLIFQGLDVASYNQLTDYILTEYRQNIALYDFIPPLIEFIEFNTNEKFYKGPTDNMAWAVTNGVTLASITIATLRGLNRLRKGDFSFFASIRRGGQWLGGLFKRRSGPKGISINNQKALPEARVVEFPTTAPPTTPPSTAGVTGKHKGPNIEVGPPPTGGTLRSAEDAANTSLVTRGKGPNGLQVSGTNRRRFRDHPFWGNSHRQRRIRDYTVAGGAGFIFGANHYRQEHMEENYNSPMKQLELVHEDILAEIVLANKRAYEESKQGRDANYFRETLSALEDRIGIVARIQFNGIQEDDIYNAEVALRGMNYSKDERDRQLHQGGQDLIVNKNTVSTITTTREFREGPFVLPKGSKISTIGMLANMHMWRREAERLNEEDEQKRKNSGEDTLVDVLLKFCVLNKEKEQKVWDEKESSYFKMGIQNINKAIKDLQETFSGRERWPIAITRPEARIVNNEGSVCRVEKGTMVSLPVVYARLQRLSSQLRERLYHIAVLDASSLLCQLEENEFRVSLSSRETIDKVNKTILDFTNYFDGDYSSKSPIVIKENYCDKRATDVIEDPQEVINQLYTHRAAHKSNRSEERYNDGVQCI